MKTKSTLLTVLALALIVQAGFAQESVNNNFKSQFNGHFQYAARVLELAKAMPADTYDWRPMKGVRSVEEVYTHIAHYNFYYPQTAMDVPVPDDVDVDKIESITGKKNVVEILERSINHVQEAVKQMPASRLSEETELYGRTTDVQGALMQLITHMSEHVGQSIAYARMNEVVPPWSR